MIIVRKGTATISTGIVLLVASVLFGSGILLYGTTFVQDSTLHDSINTRGIILWVDPNDIEPVWGAAAILNNGDKILSIDTIQIKGIDIPMSNWFSDVDQNRVSLTNYQAKMLHTGYSEINGMLNDSDPDSDCEGIDSDLNIDLDGAGGERALCLNQVSAPQILNQGERMIMYFKSDSNMLTTIDLGKTSNVNIYASSTGAPHTVTIQTP